MTHWIDADPKMVDWGLSKEESTTRLRQRIFLWEMFVFIDNCHEHIDIIFLCALMFRVIYVHYYNVTFVF